LRRVFYHGGVGDIPVGGFILPPCETGYDAPPSGLPDGEAARALAVHRGETRVYVTTSLMQAINCAWIERGMVYRVQPIGRLGADDNGVAGPDYTVRRALILARRAVPLSWSTLAEDEFHRLMRGYFDLFMALEA
jgi:hypothetical protein